MTGTVMTTTQIKNLIGRMRTSNRAARAARTYEQVRASPCRPLQNNNVNDNATNQ